MYSTQIVDYWISLFGGHVYSANGPSFKDTHEVKNLKTMYPENLNQNPSFEWFFFFSNWVN